MNREIIQQIVVKMQELKKESIRKGLKEGNIGDLNKYFTTEFYKIGCEMLKDIYEEIEYGIYLKNKETKQYSIIKTDTKTLITSIGDVTFKKRLYKDKQGKSLYLFDKVMHIRKGTRYTIDAEARAMEEVIETSYRRGGKNASLTSSLTKVTMMNMLKNLEIPRKDYVVFKKKQIDYLYIDADEDHIALQREGKFSEINKLIYVYEGTERESPISERKRLINPHYFGGISVKEGDNSRLWQDVHNYIEETYEIDKIKMIYINGDGASWIKNGVNYFQRVKFVMDKFHITEYVNRMTNHLEDSQEEAKEEMYRLLYKHDFDAYEEFVGKLYNTSINDAIMKNISDGDTYFRNNFESICLRFSGDKNVIGCSAEGHISHVLASRMSSRPMGWTIDGANKLTKLRLYKLNGGDIYTLVKANDLARQSVTLKSNNKEDYTVFSATKVLADINKNAHNEYKYIEHYHAELTDLGKTILTMHNIKF